MYFDFAQDNSGDLLIADGDFVLADSDMMHIEDTIIAHPGWWKEFPQDGVGISNYSKSTGKEQLLAREVKLQLENDGYQVDNPIVTFLDDNLTINPNAVRI